MDTYENNLEALREIDEDLANSLAKISHNEIFEVYLNENEGVENANIIDNRSGDPIYDEHPSSMLHQKQKEFIKYDNYPMLYFFGIGNGAFYKLLLKNKKHQGIMVFEPNLELIYIALNLINFRDEILENRLTIKLASSVDTEYFIAQLSKGANYFLKVYDFHIHTKYYDRYKDDIDRVNKDIIAAFKHSMFTSGNDVEDSLIGLEFSLKNIPNMIKTPGLKQLLNKADNTKNAVIVSTGPSLAKQLPLLKKIQNNVTIVCIDASFPVLAKEGIKPDIVFSIERVDLTGEFYKNTPQEFHKDVIFSLATVCHDNTINNVHGEISFFMRGDSYNMYFGLHEWGYLGGGLSAANYAYAFASHANFDNIIFIGQDLAFAKDGQSHSKNHTFGENEIKSDMVAGYVPAYKGDGNIATTKVWLSFLNSFTAQIKDSKVNTINSTEGGARIPGTRELPFEQVVHMFVDTKTDKKLIKLEKPSLEKIEASELQFKTKKEEGKVIGMQMSLDAKALYDEFDIFLKSIEEYSDDDIVDNLNMADLNILIDKITAIKDRYNDPSFANMYGTLLIPYVKNHEYNVAVVYVMRDHSELAKKRKKIEWVRVHQEWMQRIYSNLDAIVKLL